MASAQKPTGTRRRTTRAKKPATIDLKATEVKSEAEEAAKTADVKPAAKPDEKPAEKRFGREAAKTATADKTQTVKKETPKTAESKPEDKKPEAKTSKPAAEKPARQSSGFKSGLVGGVLGSMATVAGLGFVGQMQSAPDLPLIGPLYGSGNNEASVDIDALTARLEALEGASQMDLGPIEERIAKLETAKPVETANGTPEIDGKLTAVETEIASLKDTIAQISDAASSGDGATSAQVGAAIAAITSRLDAVEKTADASPTDNAGIDQKLAELETAITELSQAENVDLSPLEAKLAEVQSNLSSLGETVETNAASVAALNEQSATLENTVASVKQSEKVARSVAVNALGSALENDDPINLALASVKSLVGDTAETARLDQLSEAGIPTQKALLAELATITNSVQNPEADLSEGSLSDRFWNGMSNLVTFRSSGPVDGDTPIAILSRVQSHLEQGDLSNLLTEWAKLPEPVKTSGKTFEAGVNARLEAFSIFEKLNEALAESAG